MAVLDSTLGAALLGTLAAAILYGVTCVQTYLYFRDSRHDGQLQKSMVLFLWILDTIHLAITFQAMYFYLVTSFGNFGVLLGPTWSILSGVYLTTITDLIVRCFFARRVSLLCGRRQILALLLPVIIVTLSIVVFAAGCGFASRGFILKTWEKMNEVAWMLYTSFGAGVAADSIIAMSLCTLLVQSRTGFKHTDSMVTSLMAFSINTGLLTSICAIVCLVTYAVWPERFIFLAFYFALSKLHINSLLASLNARSTILSHSFGMSSTSTPTPVALTTKETEDIEVNKGRERL